MLLFTGQADPENVDDLFCKSLLKSFKRFEDLGTYYAHHNFLFKSFSSDDKELLLKKNIPLFEMFIMARYFGASSGHDQIKIVLGETMDHIGQF